MQRAIFLVGIVFLIQEGTAPPPRRQEVEKDEHNNVDKEEGKSDDLGLEYERYLKEVIDVLESDQTFKQKLEAAEETDIRTGKIAHELEFVDHNVRTKLDEVKRQELERLRHLAQKEFELTNGIDVEHMKILPPEHLDHENPHTFEIDDLKKLIAKVTSDLNEADKQRREEFKQYEMQKEFEQQEKLKHLKGEEKDAFEKQIKENETKHKQHDPLHHPGSKQQLEEVWEKQDHMDKQEFDPKVFFALHDLDGNGYWDQNEVKALFLKELDKMYQAGAPEDDMRERAEELERMREHVFKEADKNRDQLISYNEFLDQTKQSEFEKDPGWETVDQQPVYTHEEYLEFERRRQEEVQRMIQQGLIPPQPVYYNAPHGYDHQQMQQFPQAHHPSQAGHAVPAGYPDHGAQFQQHPGQFQQHPGQFQQHPGQFQQQPHPGQIQQHHPGQIQQPHPGQFQQQPVQNPGQFQQQGGQFQQAHPSQVQQPHPGQAQQQGGQFQQAHPSQVQQQQVQQPHTGESQQHHPGQVQQQPAAPNVQHPSQGQVHPNQFQQHAVPINAGQNQQHNQAPVYQQQPPQGNVQPQFQQAPQHPVPPQQQGLPTGQNNQQNAQPQLSNEIPHSNGLPPNSASNQIPQQNHNKISSKEKA